MMQPWPGLRSGSGGDTPSDAALVVARRRGLDCLHRLPAGAIWGMDINRLRSPVGLPTAIIIAWFSAQWLIPASVMLLWVLAAAKAISLLSALTKDVPVPSHIVQRSWLGFTQGLRQGVWPMMLLSCWRRCRI